MLLLSLLEHRNARTRIQFPIARHSVSPAMFTCRQGYGSWLLYRASQIYSHCSVPRVKEAAWSLFVSRSKTQTPAFAAASLFVPKMSAINLVKVVPEKEQERIRHALTVRCGRWQGAVCLSFI